MELLKIVIFVIQLMWLSRLINYLKEKQVFSAMKKRLQSLYNFFYRAYWVNCSEKKQRQQVWKLLKEWFLNENLRHGVYENESTVACRFEITENTVFEFRYSVSEHAFHCRSYICESYDAEATTNLFILATHFNSILRTGKVIINPENQTIQYTFNRSIADIIFNNSIIDSSIVNHFDTTKDVFWAFDKLLREDEEPSIIIADLLRMKEGN